MKCNQTVDKLVWFTLQACTELIGFINTVHMFISDPQKSLHI